MKHALANLQKTTLGLTSLTGDRAAVAIKKINLRKLLQLFYASPSQRRALLRSDIRQERDKKLGRKGTGGDFFGPFWADAKDHVAGTLELRTQVPVRMTEGKGRKRLYPLLRDGFLSWWDEKRRWRNEEYVPILQSVNAQFMLPELDCIIKVENLLALSISDDTNKIIYPYFSEKPILSSEAARIALWLLGESLEPYIVGDMRILDVLRAKSYATIDCPLQGNERQIFLTKYKEILDEWDILNREY